MSKLKDITTFILCYIYSRILSITFIETILPIIFVIIDIFHKVSRGQNQIVFIVVLEVLFFFYIRLILWGVFKLAMVKKNKNAGLYRISRKYTMLSNNELRGQDTETIEKILKDDYKEILDYGLGKYSKGIKITTHSLVVDKLKNLKYGNREQYRNCKVGRKYIVKEKFHMLTFKQFIKYLNALTNPNNIYYIEAKKYIKPRDRYKFNIRYDENKNIIVEPN